MSQGRQIGELERTRANAIQIGKVVATDYANARIRVEMAGLESAWIPWTTGRAGGDRTWAAPEVGEQVLIACPDGDPARGVAMGAIYQQAHGAPAASADITRTVYSDGAEIEYDRAAHGLKATLPAGGTVTVTAPGGVTITAPGNVTVTAPLTKVIGNLEITGVLSVGTAAGGGGTINGDLHVINGDVTVDQDVIAGGNDVSLVHHVHDGVQPGGGTTDEPV